MYNECRNHKHNHIKGLKPPYYDTKQDIESIYPHDNLVNVSTRIHSAFWRLIILLILAISFIHYYQGSLSLIQENIISTIVIISILLIYMILFMIRYTLYRIYTKHRNIYTRDTINVSKTTTSSYNLHDSLIEDIPSLSTKDIETFILSMKIFGYFELPIITELISFSKEIELNTDELMTNSLDVYIVMDGCVSIYLKYLEHKDMADNYHNSNESLLCNVQKGEIVSSMFTLLHLVSKPQDENTTLDSYLQIQYGSIHIKAIKPTRILCIPGKAFNLVYQKFPSAASQMIQVLLNRLQRVTLMTIDRYFGLAKQLSDLEMEMQSKYLTDHEWKFLLPINNDIRKNHKRRLSLIQPPRYTQTMEIQSVYPRKNSEGNIITNQPSSREQQLDDQFILSLIKRKAWKSICNLLGLESDDIPCNIADQLEIFSCYKDDILQEQDQEIVGLFFILEGSLESNRKCTCDTGSTEHLTLLNGSTGSIMGYMNCLMGINISGVQIKCISDGMIALMKRDQLYQLIARYPDILFSLAYRIDNLATSFLRLLDLALEWKSVLSGEILARVNEPSNSIYIILHGRLGSRYIDPKNKEKYDNALYCYDTPCNEYGIGESVGELDILTESTQSRIIYAIRETEIAIIPKSLFYTLSLSYPDTILPLSRLMILRALSHSDKTKRPHDIIQLDETLHTIDRSSHPLKTVSIVSIHDQVPLVSFVHRLIDALVGMEHKCLVLDCHSIIEILGKQIFSPMGRLKLVTWLSEQELQYDLILYIASPTQSKWWNKQCVCQSDLILMVGIASMIPISNDNNTQLTDMELFVLKQRTASRKELCLLYHEDGESPYHTYQRLSCRPWISSYHHIRMRLKFHSERDKPGMLYSLGVPVPMDINTAIGNVVNIHKRPLSVFRLFQHGHGRKKIMSLMKGPDKFRSSSNDFERLARRLTNKAIGLVLSGGGARGFAHIGVIKALEEAGVPIDIIGGTSMGACIGAMYAQEGEHVGVMAKAKKMTDRLTSKWRVMLDITYPITSWLTGHSFNRGMWIAFGDRQIEDLWIKYFCITTNLTKSRQQVHSSGYLWRYVRASMTLCGYLPPLSDKGDMLVDGGYVNNVPMDVMHSMGANIIIAVDVGSLNDETAVQYEDAVDGWWILFQKWILGRKINIPSMEEIQNRLAYVTCEKNRLEQLDRFIYSSGGSYYIRPPAVAKYGTTGFSHFKEIVQDGYLYGKEIVQKWKEHDLLIFGKDEMGKSYSSHKITRRYSL